VSTKKTLIHRANSSVGVTWVAVVKAVMPRRGGGLAITREDPIQNLGTPSYNDGSLPLKVPNPCSAVLYNSKRYLTVTLSEQVGKLDCITSPALVHIISLLFAKMRICP
jgi:hypothetical protein